MVTMTTEQLGQAIKRLQVKHHRGGNEALRPLGISIVGGLVLSQMLTLYTTPVIYIYIDRLRLGWGRRRTRSAPRASPVPGE